MEAEHVCGNTHLANHGDSSVFKGPPLDIFAGEIADVLIKEALRAILEPKYRGVKWAACLLDEAQKYLSVRHPRSAPEIDFELSAAADKVFNWDAGINRHGEPT